MLTKIKNISSNIILLFFSIFIVLLAIETYVRLVADDGLNLDLEMLKYANSMKVISNNKSIGIEHKKNIKKKLMGVDINLNSQGFRNNENISDSKKKILMLGDSMTFGWGANETFSFGLEKELKENYQVLNAGIGNTNTYMQINNFFNNFVQYDFDIIILNFFVNDFEKVKIKEANYIEKNFYSYTFIKSKVYKIMIHLSLINNWESFYKDTFKNEDLIKKSLDQISKLSNYCNDNNILFIINNIPELRDLKNYKFINETKIIKEYAKANNIKYINSFDILKEHDESTLWVTKEDSHANNKAHLLISRFIKSKIFPNL